VNEKVKDEAFMERIRKARVRKEEREKLAKLQEENMSLSQQIQEVRENKLRAERLRLV
jgi:hypothetical protein